MFRPKILIIECNKLTSLTVNSIKKNMPKWDFEVVKYNGSFIGTALSNTKEISLCVMSGLILNIKDGDLPGKEVLQKYDIAVSREGVFWDSKKHKHIYGLIGSKVKRKTMDLSIFLINPKRWVSIPKKDSGVLGKVKRVRMPRSMNHKSDVIVEKALNAKDALHYGTLSMGASVFNYVPIFVKGKANANEMFAYALEVALPFTEGLPEKEKEKVIKVALKTKTRIAKLRNSMAANLILGD